MSEYLDDTNPAALLMLDSCYKGHKGIMSAAQKAALSAALYTTSLQNRKEKAKTTPKLQVALKATNGNLALRCDSSALAKRGSLKAKASKKASSTEAILKPQQLSESFTRYASINHYERLPGASAINTYDLKFPQQSANEPNNESAKSDVERGVNINPSHAALKPKLPKALSKAAPQNDIKDLSSRELQDSKNESKALTYDHAYEAYSPLSANVQEDIASSRSSFFTHRPDFGFTPRHLDDVFHNDDVTTEPAEPLRSYQGALKRAQESKLELKDINNINDLQHIESAKATEEGAHHKRYDQSLVALVHPDKPYVPSLPSHFYVDNDDMPDFLQGGTTDFLEECKARNDANADCAKDLANECGVSDPYPHKNHVLYNYPHGLTKTTPIEQPTAYDALFFETFKSLLGNEINAALDNPLVTEVMVNEDGQIYVEHVKCGIHPVGKISAENCKAILRSLASILDHDLSSQQPILSGRIPYNGARFEGILPPLVKSPVFSIRTHNSACYSLDDLVDKGMVTSAQKRALTNLLLEKNNIIVAGATGTGKTTLINSLLRELTSYQKDARLITIEDTPELMLAHNTNHVSLTTSDAISMSTLVKSALRMRPDRIIVGEVRGAEALDLVDAMSSGHAGGLASVHAGSVEQALRRLSLLISRHPAAPRFIEETLVEALDYVVVVDRHPKRHISHIAEVSGYKNKTFIVKDLINDNFDCY